MKRIKESFQKGILFLKSKKHAGFGDIFVANIINQVVAFVSGFVLIRVLSKSDYGIYAYALNIYSFFALFNGFGVESACLQLGSEKRKDTARANSYMKFGLFWGSVFNLMLGLMIVLGAAFFPIAIEEAKPVLALFAVLPLLTTIFNCSQTYFRYNLMNAAYARGSVVNTVLILAGSVLGAILYRAPGLILCREAAFVISIGFGIFFLKFPIREIMKAARISITEKMDMLKISLISMLNIATGQLLYLIDVFLIGMLISDSLVVASYKTATIIPNAMLFIPTSLVVYIYPYFAEKQADKKWVKQTFGKILKYFTLVNAIITILLILLAPLIIQIFFGKQYLDAVPAFRVLSLSYFFSASFRKLTGNLLVTQRKLKVNFWIGILEGVLNVVSNWILIQWLGAIGAAITTLIICIVSSLVSVAYFVSYLNKEIVKQR